MQKNLYHIDFFSEIIGKKYTSSNLMVENLFNLAQHFPKNEIIKTIRQTDTCPLFRNKILKYFFKKNKEYFSCFMQYEEEQLSNLTTQKIASDFLRYWTRGLCISIEDIKSFWFSNTIKLEEAYLTILRKEINNVDLWQEISEDFLIHLLENLDKKIAENKWDYSPKEYGDFVASAARVYTEYLDKQPLDIVLEWFFNEKKDEHFVYTKKLDVLVYWRKSLVDFNSKLIRILDELVDKLKENSDFESFLSIYELIKKTPLTPVALGIVDKFLKDDITNPENKYFQFILYAKILSSPGIREIDTELVLKNI